MELIRLAGAPLSGRRNKSDSAPGSNTGPLDRVHEPQKITVPSQHTYSIRLEIAKEFKVEFLHFYLSARAARASRVFDTQGVLCKYGMGSSLTWQGSALELIRMADVPIIKQLPLPINISYTVLGTCNLTFGKMLVGASQC